jgi:hypothetical protein
MAWRDCSGILLRLRRHHQRSACKLRECELPPEQNGHDDAQLGDQIRRGEHERDRGGEVRPFRNSDRSVLGESSGRSRVICLLPTTACTIADSPKLRISAYRISQNMAKAMLSAWRAEFISSAV